MSTIPKLYRQMSSQRWEDYLKPIFRSNESGPWFLERVVHGLKPNFHYMYVVRKDNENEWKCQSYELQAYVREEATDTELLCLCFTHGNMVNEDIWIKNRTYGRDKW